MSDESELRAAAKQLLRYYEETGNPRILDGQAVTTAIAIARGYLALLDSNFYYLYRQRAQAEEEALRLEACLRQLNEEKRKTKPSS